MSSVIGSFRGGRQKTDARFDLASSRLAHRGNERCDTLSTKSGVLRVARYGWECQDSLAGPAQVVTCGDWAAAVDGVLYYQSDLCRRLVDSGASLDQEATSAGELILRAFIVFGVDCLRHLEGDFAFVLWNRTTDEIFAARDFAGSRPLYWAEAGGSVTVTSGVEATLALSGLERQLIPSAMAANMAGYPVPGEGTCYRGVRTLPAGHYAHWLPREPCHVVRWWTPPTGVEALRFDDAAEELRTMLVAAIEERMAPSGVNAVWLSGGWDSTAVMGAARQVRVSAAWQAVSISYPPGDQGREDDVIASVAEFCSVPVEWIDSEALPVLAEPERGPFGHAFAGWLRGLASTAANQGARVSFSGYGGDQLFQTSDVFLADLLRRGRLVSLGRELSHSRWRGEFLNFLRWAAKPALPEILRAAIASLRGGRRRGHLDRAMPPWACGEASEMGVAGSLAAAPREPGEDLAMHEMRWYLTDSYFPAVNAAAAETALECGTEVRAPLMDERIVRLALSRPQEERTHRGETKRLLRSAMEGLLPPETLASRPTRTGATGEYFRRHLRRSHDWVPELFSESRLADMGLIRPEVFLRWWHWFESGGVGPWDAALHGTIQTERWLQGMEVSDHVATAGLVGAAH